MYQELIGCDLCDKEEPYLNIHVVEVLTDDKSELVGYCHECACQKGYDVICLNDHEWHIGQFHADDHKSTAIKKSAIEQLRESLEQLSGHFETCAQEWEDMQNITN